MEADLITSFIVLHGSELKSSFGVFCLLRLSDWWNFVNRNHPDIMGNVVFPPQNPLLNTIILEIIILDTGCNIAG